VQEQFNLLKDVNLLHFFLIGLVSFTNVYKEI